MKPRSAKAKGRRFQQEVQQKILEVFQGVLEPDDVRPVMMSGSGVDIQLSPHARKTFPYSVECKNQEKIQIWQALKQTQENTLPNTEPALIFRRNNTEAFVAIRFEHFMSLIAKELLLQEKADKYDGLG